MPEICRFYGIVIKMYLIDRQHPPRHIHINYGEYEAVMELMNLNIIEGSLPKKCRQLVREWAELHQEELIDLGYAKISRCYPFGVKMKIRCFKHINAYCYLLTFENDVHKEVDLINLIGNHVSLEELNTAHINTE